MRKSADLSRPCVHAQILIGPMQLKLKMKQKHNYNGNGNRCRGPKNVETFINLMEVIRANFNNINFIRETSVL